MSGDLCLVLDIGGTNTRIALTQGHTLMTDRVQKYANADYPNLAAVIETYLAVQNAGTFDRVCVAAAGPVTDDRAEMTNLDWVIDARDISSVTKSSKVGVINDLQAQGHSLHMLDENDTRCVLTGTHQVRDNDTKIVIGMGTGFNAAPVFHTSAGRYVPPSEIGHARIAAANAEQAEVVAHIQDMEGFASNEHVLAGRGLERIDHALNNCQDRTAAQIMEAAGNGDDAAINVANMQA
ncbi:MAG: glucokinase, partial [Rhodobacteraceae bacterium]|nr:glucokinase [Paracoccaceae bacterium]